MAVSHKSLTCLGSNLLFTFKIKIVPPPSRRARTNVKSMFASEPIVMKMGNHGYYLRSNRQKKYCGRTQLK